MLQRHAVQILHGDERLPVLLADVIDRADVGVVQGGRRLRLALETGQSLRVPSHFGEELQGDKTVKTRVLSLVDDAHAAATKLLDNAVVQTVLPIMRRHGGGGRQRQVNDGAELAAPQERSATWSCEGSRSS